MSFLVANETGAPPIWVKSMSSWTRFCFEWNTLYRTVTMFLKEGCVLTLRMLVVQLPCTRLDQQVSAACKVTVNTEQIVSTFL